VPDFVTCPSCQRLLQVQADFVVSSFTCPACLARIQYPGKPTAALGTKYDYLVEHEVQRDVRRTGTGIIILAVLGGVGLSQFLWCIIPFSAQGDFSAVGIALAFILFLGLLSTAIMFWRTRHDPSARGIGRVVVGTLALAGVVVLLLLAAFIVFFVVCLVAISRMK